MSLKACIPVVAKLGPVIVGFPVSIGNQSDTLNLLITVLGWSMQPQWSAVELCERAAAHLGHEQGLGMHANLQVVTHIVIAVRSFHVNVTRKRTVFSSRRRIGVN